MATSLRSLELIEQQKHVLANTIRTFVRKQKKNWQKIPYLSLMDQGRSGWLDYAPYQAGYFMLDASGGTFGAAVDCESGELVHAMWLDHLPLSDDGVLGLAGRVETHLIATRHVAMYEHELAKCLTDAEIEQEPQRVQLRARYSFIKPGRYRRPSNKVLVDAL